MRTNVIFGLAGIAAVAGMSVAADVRIEELAVDTSARQLLHFNEEGAGPGLMLPGLRAQSGTSGAPGGVQGEFRTLNFGVNGTARVQQFVAADATTPAQHAFYLGTAAGLNSAQNGWFNTVGGVAGVGADTTVLGFGNRVDNGFNFSANRVVITFDPGVQGFAFNFADIGDVSPAELQIFYRDDGPSSTLMLGATTDSVTGFFSLLVEAGRTLDRITLRQTQPGGVDFNDGFLLYGFTTLTVVPLPPAAWAGLAMLAGVAGVRKLRRR